MGICIFFLLCALGTMDEVYILSKMATRWWMGVDFAIWNLDVLLSIGQNEICGQNEIWLKLSYEYIQIYRLFNAPLCIYVYMHQYVYCLNSTNGFRHAVLLWASSVLTTF